MSKLKYFMNNFEFLIAGFLSVVMVIVLFVQVVTRYIFSYSLAFAEELGVMLFIITVYFGAIGATRRNQHLKIELVINMLKPKAKIVFSILADIAFVFANVFIIYGTVKVTMNLYNYGMTTAILQVPKWICYTVLPFSFAVISFRLIQGLPGKFKELKDIDSSGPPDENPPRTGGEKE